MNYIIARILLVFYVFYILFPFNGIISTYAAPATYVIISEVTYDSNAAENEGEWIELYNPTNATVNLNGWTLGEEAGGVEYTFTGGASIAANSFLLLVNDTATFNIDYPGVTPDIDMDKTDAPNCVSDTECLRLNNTSGDSLTLKDNGGTTIDFLAWEGLYGFDLNGDEGFSICRRNLDDTDTDAEWANNCEPTPGTGTFVTQFPGGVPIASLLWAKADSEGYSHGDTVTVLNDRSGNDRDGTNSGTPSFDTTNTMNFYPTLSFDGSSDGFIFPSYSFPTADKNYTMYTVFQSPLTQDDMTLQYVGRNFGTNNSTITYINSDGSTHDDFDNGATNLNITPAGSIETDTPTIISFNYNSSNDEKNTYINSENVSILTGVVDHNASNSASSDRGIGFNADSSTNYFLGSIAEILLYDDELDATSRQKIDSYLALKYGITINQTVSTDYINSSGAILWNATTNAAYTNNIIGIGQNNLSDLNQKISKSIHTGAILTLATDDDFTSLNTDGGRISLMDGKFLIIGNDAGDVSSYTGELDTGLYQDRVFREWKVANTGGVGEVFLNFDGYDDSYVLLTDADGDFSSGAINEGNLSALGTISLTLNDGEYFTLASPVLNVTPTDIILSGSGTIDENSASGSIIGTFTTTDLDVADTHTYTFTSGTGDTDNARFTLSGSILSINNSPDFETHNSYNIRIQTDDGNGGTYEEIIVVHVNDLDEVAPIITLTGDGIITHEVNTLYTDLGAEYSDNMDGTGAVVGTGVIDTTMTGSYMLTYDYTDSSSNPALQVTRTINVVDTTLPVIILTGSGTMEVLKNTIYSDQGAVCSDNYDTTCNVMSSGTVDTTSTGSYIIYYDVTDISGNSAIQVSRTVNVVNGNTPIIILTGSGTITQEVGIPYIDLGAEYSDIEDGTGVVVGSGIVDISTLGVYTLYYDFTDSSNNLATQVTRTINIVDTTNPIITLLGSNPVNLEIGESYTDAGAEFSDNYNGTGAVVAAGGPVTTSATGSFTLTYDYTDANSNPALQVTRVVNVLETTPPVISLIGTGSITLVKNSSYIEAGASASDNLDGDISLNISTINPVNTAVIGSYIVTYNVDDASGNTATQITRTVDVVAGNTPTLTLLGSTPVFVEAGTIYLDAGAIANDSEDGDISGDIVTINPVNISATGAYTVIYSVTDSSDNVASQVTRTVNVVDSLSDGDGDGVPDVVELEQGTNPADITDYLDTDDDLTPNYLDSDDDGDGAPDTVESSGPNNGDFNNDGISDDLQKQVTTIVSSTTGQYTSLATPGSNYGSTRFDMVLESNLALQDSESIYPVGLADFELECTNLGDTALIEVYLDQEYDTNSWIYKKYNRNVNIYTDISSIVNYRVENVGGENITVMSYSITDGGIYDEDGLVNGVIIDPSGPAIANTVGGGVGSAGARTYVCRDPQADNYATNGFSKPELCEYSQATEILEQENPEETIQPEDEQNIDVENEAETIENPEEIIIEKGEDYIMQNDFASCSIISDIQNPNYQYNEDTFFDISQSTQRENILKFAQIGVVDGYEDGGFGPTNEITRTEFLKVALISHCYDYKNETTSLLSYTDVDISSWQAKVIKKAEILGMINGDIDENGNSVFRPNDIISKAEAVKILMRLSLIDVNNPVSLGYTDVTNSWHEKYVITGETLGLFDSERDNGIFNPDSGVERESMIELVNSLVQLYK